MYTCVHIGGKFVGNDCVKLLKHAKHIMAALKPRQIKIANGTYTIFGTHNKAQLYYTLLHKLYQLYQLFSAARPLCMHEIDIFDKRATTFAIWFARCFPTQSHTPKMHIVTYHMPILAKIYKTIGMFAEQSAESIHPVYNKLNRQYACINNDEDRITAAVRECWILSHPDIHTYKPNTR